MCTRRISLVAAALTLTLGLTACGGPTRTGTSFCRQLSHELPQIAQRIETTKDVSAMVNRYQRLLDRAPLTIEKDLAVMTNLLHQAAKLNANKPDEVQALADATYAANQSAINVRNWVKSTCAVDISSGLNIEPPRVATTTTVPAPTTTTTKAPPAPTPTVTSVPGATIAP